MLLWRYSDSNTSKLHTKKANFHLHMIWFIHHLVGQSATFRRTPLGRAIRHESPDCVGRIIMLHDLQFKSAIFIWNWNIFKVLLVITFLHISFLGALFGECDVVTFICCTNKSTTAEQEMFAAMSFSRISRIRKKTAKITCRQTRFSRFPY